MITKCHPFIIPAAATSSIMYAGNHLAQFTLGNRPLFIGVISSSLNLNNYNNVFNDENSCFYNTLTGCSSKYGSSENNWSGKCSVVEMEIVLD